MTPLSLYIALTPHRDWLRALPVDEQPSSYVVPYVAQQVAQCKGIAVEEVGHATSRNFETLFKGVAP